MRVLVVEDEAMIALQMEAILARAGHVVVGTASNATEAVALAQASEPDLALVDVRLANETDGPAAAREMRERFGVPSVMVTSFCQEARRAKGAALACLEKPFYPHELLGAVEAAEALLKGESPPHVPARLELYTA